VSAPPPPPEPPESPVPVFPDAPPPLPPPVDVIVVKLLPEIDEFEPLVLKAPPSPTVTVITVPISTVCVDVL
jgi:hypothetical protein